MKKLILLAFLAALIYGGYLYFVKNQNPFASFLRWNKTVVTAPSTAVTTPKTKNSAAEENRLVLELELNKPVAITATTLYADQISLTRINKAGNFCNIRLYKSSGTLSKKIPLRKVLGRRGTIEVSLLELKEKSVIVSMSVVSNPKDKIEVLK